ncbi:MAG: hypothetical protein U0176_12035 [Bacteroidia bacterium]
MKTQSTQLNYLKGLFFACCIALVAFGCEKEVITPESNEPTISGSYHYIQRPVAQCGPSIFNDLRDGATNLGTLEITNSSSELYLIFNLNNFKFLEEVKVFTQDASNMPMDDDGNIDVERFGFMQTLTTAANDYTLTLPLSSMPTCMDIMVRARVSTRNMWGQTTGINYVWMTGTPVANGFMFHYCAPSCISGNTNDNNAI